MCFHAFCFTITCARYICMYACVYVYMYKCVYKYTYIYIQSKHAHFPMPWNAIQWNVKGIGLIFDECNKSNHGQTYVAFIAWNANCRSKHCNPRFHFWSNAMECHSMKCKSSVLMFDKCNNINYEQMCVAFNALECQLQINALKT